ncbi:UDP-xylose and UDP-N-acetylglucosamine transporter-like [Gigantopelta aegis]|uniref:UDP-xylose and UDP-N-acetylglucosamine transporter-like n=1 Tax=Gigantopelta aegis TaxID=1735272 RepID=UPI001B88D8B0|nr:UDP-xylose and UDP-N-acetylglucosamine transporter-like [Gigantopelta aegis]
MKPAIAITLVFLACCSNVVFLEFMVSEFPGSGNLITFSQFLLISIEGFVFTAKCGTKAPVIPFRYYLFMVTLFFAIQVGSNAVFSFNISMPLQMIFRSGSLVANLIMGMIILKRSYKMSKFVSVALITCGIIICTLSSASQVESHPNHTGDVMYDFLIWLVGLGMLVFCLMMTAWMGIFQEQTYQKFGKHPSEALFYNHCLPLPLFLFLAKDIYNHVILLNSSDPVLIPILEFSIPKMWIFLIFNNITQYICIRSVFILTTECQSLTVTLVVTLRKFISLIFSVLYFQNPFTVYHTIGAILVFFGTLLFTEIIPLGKAKIKEH